MIQRVDRLRLLPRYRPPFATECGGGVRVTSLDATEKGCRGGVVGVGNAGLEQHGEEERARHRTRALARRRARRAGGTDAIVRRGCRLSVVAFSGGGITLAAYLVQRAFGEDLADVPRPGMTAATRPCQPRLGSERQTDPGTGARGCVAAIGVSPALPAWQLANARDVAEVIGITLWEVPTAEGQVPEYVANEVGLSTVEEACVYLLLFFLFFFTFTKCHCKYHKFLPLLSLPFLSHW